MKCTVPFSLVVPLLSLSITHCYLLSLVVTRCITHCHSLSLVAPLVVTHCHSSSLIAIRCTTHCHSLSFVVIRCHSLSLVVPLVVTRCHSMYHSSVFLQTITPAGRYTFRKNMKDNKTRHKTCSKITIRPQIDRNKTIQTSSC